MTTLTQSDLDDMRRKIEAGIAGEWKITIQPQPVLSLLDHIAQLTADNARKKAKKRQFPSLCNPKQNAESLLQYYAKQGIGDMALLQALEGLLIEFVSNEARITELTAERDGICLGCGSRWDDERLTAERANNPKLLSCCPERKFVAVATLAARIAELEAQSSAQFVAGLRRAAEIAASHVFTATAFNAGGKCAAAILAEAALKGEG